jgi:hypothetical protein
MTKKEWEEIWVEFDDVCDIEVDHKFQKMMSKKFGDQGFYYMDDEASWTLQKALIRKLVEAKLKKQNEKRKNKPTMASAG